MEISEQEVVQKLAEAMRALPEDRQVNPESVHLFAPGIYVRVLHMPAGSVIVSKIHRTEHFALALSGTAIVRVGEHIERVVGPRLMKTLPGTQRALYIETDAVWLTMHPLETADTVADESDLPAIEERIIAKSHDDLIEHQEVRRVML